MRELASYLGVGTLSAMILSLIVEITPFIKINPLQWLGKHINKALLDNQSKIEKKLDDHITIGYRESILEFQEKILYFNFTFTLEQWNQVLNICEKYEAYIKDNNLTNGQVTEAIEFIKAEYHEALKNRKFRSIKGGNNNDTTR